MGHHERPVEPFSELHAEHGHVRATLLHDPTVDGLDLAIYVDGSSSRIGDDHKEHTAHGRGLWWDLFGWGDTPVVEIADDTVEPQDRWILQYLATKDRNGLLRIAYWACGTNGRDTEVIGELQGDNVGNFQFPGPRHRGDTTTLEPALRDYVGYIRDQARHGARQGCAVIITDRKIHDADAVQAYSAWIAKEIGTGGLPRMRFLIVGVGKGVDEAQLADLCRPAYPAIGHLWRHGVAAETKDVAELVAALLDETVTVAAGGRVTDERGNIVKVYEGRLPAVLEFDVPEGAHSFALEVNGQRFVQRLPDGHDEHRDDDSDEI